MTAPTEEFSHQDKLNLDLLLSCSMGLTEKVKALVSEGADLFTTHSDGQTAMHYAAAYGHEDLLEFCLEQGMSPNRPNAIGRTPIFNATENSRPEMIRLLVNAGADPNYRDHEGKTPLHLGAQFARLESLRALAANNADPFLHDNAGQTPLDIARIRQNTDVLALLGQAISRRHAQKVKRHFRKRRSPSPRP